MHKIIHICISMFVMCSFALTIVFGEFFYINSGDVIDGDTLKVQKNGELILVRLIGIDAPEKDAVMYNEATDYLRSLVVDKLVEFKSDPYKPDKDKFGRLLRYVIVDKKNINYMMVTQGYVKEFLYDLDYVFRKKFLVAQLFAMKAKLGIRSGGDMKIYSDCYGKNYSIKHGEVRYENSLLNYQHLFKKESCYDGLIQEELYLDGLFVKNESI